MLNYMVLFVLQWPTFPQVYIDGTVSATAALGSGVCGQSMCCPWRRYLVCPQCIVATHVFRAPGEFYGGCDIMIGETVAGCMRLLHRLTVHLCRLRLSQSTHLMLHRCSMLGRVRRRYECCLQSPTPMGSCRS